MVNTFPFHCYECDTDSLINRATDCTCPKCGVQITWSTEKGQRLPENYIGDPGDEQ